MKEKRTRNGYLYTKTNGLMIRWKQDIMLKAGIGILDIEITPTGESYRLIGVPKNYYRDMLVRPDPETLMNQLIRMYL